MTSRKVIRRGLTICAAALTLMIGWAAWLQLSGNFHAVIDEQLYRAAQMNSATLRRWHERHHIASVLNLRGANPGTDWYEDETAATRDLGIAHIDFAMSAAHELNDAEARQLIKTMRDAPKPLLIHCMSGADRTGLAAALYIAAIAKGSEGAAEWQLSPRYGHIGLPWISRAYPMDETWERLEYALGFPHS